MFFQGEGHQKKIESLGFMGDLVTQIQKKATDKEDEEYLSSSHKNPAVIQVYSE